MLMGNRCVDRGVLSIVALAGVLGFSTLAAGQAALIIDHRCTKVEAIPPYWLEQAKLLTMHYAHTSHGSQLVDGAERLEQLYPTYSIAVRGSATDGLPPVENPPALRIYDGNPPETYIEPDDYWESAAGLNRTRAVAQTGDYQFSMWSWCGQASWYSEVQIQAYLDAMAQFETEFPGMRFILMTGHTDGSGVDGTLNVRNNQIRDYARTHGMVLFDFADIESHDPDWNSYLELGCTDYGSYSGGDWPAQWCAVHPGSDLCVDCGCAHSQSIICNLKGRALWWMMARLAGWEGTDRADIDWDGDVDASDWSVFSDCFDGPVVPPAPVDASPSDCREAFDQDEDGDVDLADLQRFQIAFTG